jgi:putative peptidoglycan lipid II flippase
MVASLFEKSTKFITQQQTSIMSAAAVIGGMSVVSAFLGILKNGVIESVFFRLEQKPLIDAFWAAFRVPDFLFQLLVVGVLSATFIPVYTRVMNNEEERQKLVSTLMTSLGFLYIVIAIIIGVFAYPIVRSYTGAEFKDFQVELATSMMRIMLIAQFFFMLSNFLSGILQSNRSFILPALAPVLYNVGIIVGTIFLSPMVGIFGPAIGVLIGAIIHFLIQLPFAYRYGFRFRLGFNLRNMNVKEVMHLMVPRGATQSTNAVEDFVGTYIATSLGGTFLRLVTYASQLGAAPVRFIGVSIAQAALPFLSSEAKEHDHEGFVRLLIKTLHQISFFMMPIGAILLVLRIPIVRLAFVVSRKGLPWPDTVLIGRMVAIYALAIAFQAMIHVLLRAYYAIKDTRIPFLIAAVSMGVNISVMFLCRYLFNTGLISVAIGSVAAATTEFLLLSVVLLRRMGIFHPREFFFPQGKMIVATVLMGISLYIPMKLLDQLVFDTTRVVGLLSLTTVVSIVGMTVYILFSRLLNVEQLSILASIRGKFDGWRTKLSRSTEILNTDDEVQV